MNTQLTSSALAWGMRQLPLFRGKGRLQQQVLPKTGLVRARIFGLPVELDLSDVIQRDICAGLYEPYETAWLRTHLLPGMSFVDVGANIGYYTWLASSLVGESGRVLAFEPGPYAAARLSQILDQGFVKNVVQHQVALSDYTGEGILYVPPSSAGNYNPSMTPYLPGMTAVTTPIGVLDDYLERHNFETVDVIKIDVEGLELDVLQGASRALNAHRIRAVLCECGDHAVECGSSQTDLNRFLTDFGFARTRSFPSKWGVAVYNSLYQLS
jgi:FkbM family methyltransferase